MPYENIIATAIHYVEVVNIEESYLEFRKPVVINEENVDYPQSDIKYTTHHYGIQPDSHHDGVMNRYLGLIKCVEGASVIFPNTLQHRVKEFQVADHMSAGKRIIICFFVIDPKNLIVSTAEVPPQQCIFTVEEAELYRLDLMKQRKYFVDEMNEVVFERPYSLCEH
jgi:hypothetical protein